MNLSTNQSVSTVNTKTIEKWQQVHLFNYSVQDKNNESKKLLPLTSIIDLVKYPVITEKTIIALLKNRQYTFDVDRRLSKTQIKKLFENLFNVDVIAVNTHIPPRKKLRVGFAQGFRPAYKRAIITLKEGQSIV